MRCTPMSACKAAGWKTAPTCRGRIWHLEIPNVVPKDRVRSDPQGVMGDGSTPQDKAINIYQRDPRRETQQLRLANRTRWGSDALRQEVGVYWQDTDDWFKDPAVRRAPTAPPSGRSGGPMARWARACNGTRRWPGRAAPWTARSTPSARQRPRFAALWRLRPDRRQPASPGGADWQLAPAWSLVGQLGGSRATPRCHQPPNRPNPESAMDVCHAQAGAELAAHAQHPPVGQISRSQEAPTFLEIVTGAVPNPGNPATAVSGSDHS